MLTGKSWYALGMTTNKDRVGNIHHNVQPVIGWMRLAIANGTTLNPSQMDSAVKKLYEALANADEID